jgi:hypothetical protein
MVAYICSQCDVYISITVSQPTNSCYYLLHYEHQDILIDIYHPIPPPPLPCAPSRLLSECASTRPFSKGQVVGFHATGSSLALSQTFLVSSLPNISMTGVTTGRIAKSVEKLISATSRMFTQYSRPMEAKYTHARLPIDHQTRPWIR